MNWRQRRARQGQRAVQPDAEKRQIAAGGHRKALFLAVLDVQKPRVRLGGIGRAEADDELFFTRSRQGRIRTAGCEYAGYTGSSRTPGTLPEGFVRCDCRFKLQPEPSPDGGQHFHMRGSLFDMHYALPSPGFMNISRRELATTRRVEELCRSALIMTEIPLAAPRIRPTELMAMTSAKF